MAAPGSLPNLLINAMLEKYKIPPSDVKLRQSRRRSRSLQGGGGGRRRRRHCGRRIHGDRAQGREACWSRGRDVLPNYVRLCLTVTGKTLAARREDAINFVAAEMDALHFAVTHRDDTIALTREAIHAKPDDPRPPYAYDDTIKRDSIDPAVTLPLDKLTWMQDELLKAGNLKTPIDLAKITAPDIRDEAAKRAGNNLDFHRRHDAGGENVFRLGELVRDALLVRIAQEQFQRRPVGLDAVGKQIAAEHLPHARGVVGQPRHRIARHRGIEDALEAAALGFLEGIVEIARDPRLAVEDRPCAARSRA